MLLGGNQRTHRNPEQTSERHTVQNTDVKNICINQSSYLFGSEHHLHHHHTHEEMHSVDTQQWIAEQHLPEVDIVVYISANVGIVQHKGASYWKKSITPKFCLFVYLFICLLVMLVLEDSIIINFFVIAWTCLKWNRDCNSRQRQHLGLINKLYIYTLEGTRGSTRM